MRPPLRDILGLQDLPSVARQLALTFRGDGSTPPSRFGLSSLRSLQPRLAIACWLGRRPSGRRVPILNLFSHVRPDPATGWSVKVTIARDFRGLQATYDSHNGTDFAVPPGTPVVATAPGHVVRVSSEFDRGGLKIMIDHGQGLFTTSNHLSRALVSVGERVRRGQVIALSGMSGVDGLLAFPWNAPHVHFNVWLDGEPVDPFGGGGAIPLWREGLEPRPPAPNEPDEAVAPTPFDAAAVDAVVASCVHEASRRTLAATDPSLRGAHTLFLRIYYPTRFRDPRPLGPTFGRRPALTLPFSVADYDGIAWPTKGGWR